ncbi:multifunctional CCA addition/repair protein [Alteromonas sp. a30]|uniref:multifunctional CCA addition/repair protein n=1 Tax=Alteromonas sp. a30 TaxID=2730917 RepID=UPI00227DA2FC|nr:multifunctional CCA addition/repair protein [Alteromonas sp. a30]MCY7296011.1 multifunctional CCA addition/repair protein [Alteromonas sp. a30]
MQIFLVGGAVRDQLLQRPVYDKDWVVVGASPKDMLTQGFQQVGKDFPVFLHPETKEEYALARTERKTGSGYTGFVCDFSTDITLEQDLLRRDLTINAMALDANNKLIDPYNGKQDLDKRILRHVSPAFVEDPLRVLRVARFAARYHQYGFTLAPETLELMQELSHSGELESLAAERVWKETERSLLGDDPQQYFAVLKEAHALSYWFKEIDCLWGVPNPPKHHPEIDTGVHTLMVLEQAAKLSDELEVRYAALTHDLGKGITDPTIWPSHTAHDVRGVPLVEALSERLKCPTKAKDIAKLVAELHIRVHTSLTLKPSTIVKLFDKMDVWRRAERFEQILLACEADARGRTGFEDRSYPQANYLRECFNAAQNVDVKAIVDSGVKGPDIKEAVRQKRIELVASVTKPQ